VRVAAAAAAAGVERGGGGDEVIAAVDAPVPRASALSSGIGDAGKLDTGEEDTDE
jgi:hypothetical protein